MIIFVNSIQWSVTCKEESDDYNRDSLYNLKTDGNSRSASLYFEKGGNYFNMVPF